MGITTPLPLFVKDLMPVRIVIIKNLKTTDAGENVENEDQFYTVGGNVN